MQEVFEKIIERLEKNKESFKDAREKTFCRVTETDDCDSCKADHYLDARLETINSAIEIVKQAAEQYNDGWIPCSERLPEDKQTCLVTARIYFTPDHVDEIDNYIGVGIDTYSKQFGWLGTEPIAWQPLPAPYQPIRITIKMRSEETCSNKDMPEWLKKRFHVNTLTKRKIMTSNGNVGAEMENVILSHISRRESD